MRDSPAQGGLLFERGNTCRRLVSFLFLPGTVSHDTWIITPIIQRWIPDSLSGLILGIFIFMEPTPGASQSHSCPDFHFFISPERSNDIALRHKALPCLFSNQIPRKWVPSINLTTNGESYLIDDAQDAYKNTAREIRDHFSLTGPEALSSCILWSPT